MIPLHSTLKFQFSWENGQRVCSHLFDNDQGDEVTGMLQQLYKDKDWTGTTLFLQLSKGWWPDETFKHGVDCVLDIYKGPLP